MTVAELRDYITRRKNKKISIVKRGKNAFTRSMIRIAIFDKIMQPFYRAKKYSKESFSALGPRIIISLNVSTIFSKLKMNTELEPL